jgi:hypothetical protein
MANEVPGFSDFLGGWRKLFRRLERLIHITVIRSPMAGETKPEKEMSPPLPSALYPIFRGLTPGDDGSLHVTREYLYGVLEISRLDEDLPQDVLLAEELALLSPN